MMPIYLDEAHARGQLDMTSVLASLRAIFTAQAGGLVTNVPRTRTQLLGRALNITAAADTASERFAVKLYGGGTFHILLYSKMDGLLATMEADWLGQLRTGAATGLATSLMARPESRRVGLIGAGRQAQAQLLALDAIGMMDQLAVYARRRDKLEAFCAFMHPKLRCTIQLAESAEAAVKDADIVVTATTSSTPVVKREWLGPGTHVNGMGANAASRMELDPAIVAAAALVVVDDVDQSRKEAGEFIALDKEGRLDWTRVKPLHEIVSAGAGPRDGAAISVFKSLGSGLEDLAIASLLYDRTVAR